MSVDALARVIAVALEAARQTDEERLRAIVQEELARLTVSSTARLPAWQTPPHAARTLNVSLKRVRALLRAGRVEVRPRGFGPSRRPKVELLISSLESALHGDTTREPAEPGNVAQWATQRRLRSER